MEFGFRGNIGYASLNVCQLYRPSRRDDLISVAYLLLDLLRGFNFGSTLNEDDDLQTKLKIVCKQKTKWSVSRICRQLQLDFLRPFLEEVFSLQFKEEPCYSKLRHLLTVPLLEMEQTPTPCILGSTMQTGLRSVIPRKNIFTEVGLDVPDEAEPSLVFTKKNKMQKKNPFVVQKISPMKNGRMLIVTGVKSNLRLS